LVYKNKINILRIARAIAGTQGISGNALFPQLHATYTAIQGLIYYKLECNPSKTMCFLTKGAHHV
jgi:hypothetical protein